MSNTSKRTKFLRSIYRLSAKDKAVLGILVAAIVAVLVFGLFKISNSGLSLITAEFPSSTLLKKPNIGQRRVMTFDALSKLVVYPGTDLGVYVGGDELEPKDSGQAFRFDPDTLIITAVSPTSVTTEEAMRGIVPGIFLEQPDGCKFEKKVYDKGYLNTLPVEYIAGIITETSGKQHYILAYRRDIGGTVAPYLAVIVEDNSELHDAKKALDQMYFTMIDVKPVEENNQQTDSTSREQSVTDDMTTAETLETMRAEREHVKDKINNIDGSDYIEMELELAPEEAYRDTMFFFSYTNTENTPSKAYLTCPSGEIIAPEAVNKDNSGRILFTVKNAVSGKYLMTITNDIEFGYYSFSVLSADEYTEAFN